MLFKKGQLVQCIKDYGFIKTGMLGIVLDVGTGYHEVYWQGIDRRTAMRVEEIKVVQDA